MIRRDHLFRPLSLPKNAYPDSNIRINCSQLSIISPVIISTISSSATRIPSPASSPLDIWDEIDKAFPGSCYRDPAYLLFLFMHLVDRSPTCYLFTRAKSPQRRWTDHGSEREITASMAGLDQQLIDILSNQTRLDYALESFDKSEGTNETCIISLNGQLQIRLSQSLSDQAKEEWSIKAIKWICFVFPRNERWNYTPALHVLYCHSSPF